MQRRLLLPGLALAAAGLLAVPGARADDASQPDVPAGEHADHTSDHDHSTHDHSTHDHVVQYGEIAGGPIGTLGADALSAFWQTPFVECDGTNSPTNISGPPSCDDTTFTWSVELTDPAERLRVDFDYPYRQDDHELTVTLPDGSTVSRSSSNTYSHGVIVDTAEAGEYEITLEVVRTAGSVVRLRAGVIPPSDPEGQLLPNLRVTPPLELGFAAPINPANSTFMAGDDQNPGVVVNGEPLYSCTADEVQEASDPTRNDPDDVTILTECLRFTAGPHNIGEGHFDLRFPIVDRAAAGDTDRIEEMTQFIHHSDGSMTQRPAGFYEYHVTHGHYHYLDILYYELLAVDEATGTLVDAGVGHKSGFCPADQGYGDWYDFDQLPKGTVGGEQGASCFALSGNGALGLTAGWGDFYRWQRPGQFVDFSGQGDGLYVVRATVDVLDNVLESDETDNSSYALVRVTGTQVDVLERGYGDSPYDPQKVLADDNRGQPPVAGLVAIANR